MPITIDGSGTITGLSAGGLPDASIVTADIADTAITAAKMSGAQNGSAPIYAARAWVNFNGTGTVAIRASGNVSSITDTGTGTYTVNFTTAMPDVNYCAVFGGDNINGVGNSIINSVGSATTSSLPLMLTDHANVVRDDDTVQVAIFR